MNVFNLIFGGKNVRQTTRLAPEFIDGGNYSRAKHSISVTNTCAGAAEPEDLVRQIVG